MSIPSTGLITVLVGAEETCFTLARATLSTHSAFFRAALSGRWPMNDDRIRLPTIDVKHFSIFHPWLSNPNLDILASANRLVVPSFRSPSTLTTEVLARLWLMADFLLADGFQSAVHETFRAHVLAVERFRPLTPKSLAQKEVFRDYMVDMARDFDTR